MTSVDEGDDIIRAWTENQLRNPSAKSEEEIDKIAELIAEITVSLAFKPINEKIAILNGMINDYTRERWMLLEDYDIMIPTEQTKIDKIVSMIDKYIEMLKPLLIALEARNPKPLKTKNPKGNPFNPFGKQSRQPSRPGDEIGDADLGGSRSNQSNKTRAIKAIKMKRTIMRRTKSRRMKKHNK